MVQKVYVTYNQVHKLCQASADHILNDFKPNLMIAIGGGGYVPARILRSFLKRPGSPNIPIQAIGLSLYEQIGQDDPEEEAGTKVTRTQWLDMSSLQMSNLVGKNILIVDEVDDTRTTLEYAVKELEKDVKAATQQLGREGEKTKFFIFVLHVRHFSPDLRQADLCTWRMGLNMGCAEQRQTQERPATDRYVGAESVLCRQDGHGRVDMLPMGIN
ncbi:MAG: hypoxanthine-guanine phosphoribosyltransferase, partial [Icmadophila ericetorum]|nr:hypoxanthine-guanine phosphoribosyltransferase [Icmadophila ericetorum]